MDNCYIFCIEPSIYYFCLFKQHQLKMDYEQFKDYFWEYVPKTVITDSELNITRVDFCDEVMYQCFRMYDMSNVDIDFICKIAVELIRLSKKEFNK